ncbi:MAG: holA [Gammaproteobacteria bacterium]|jgi:DNA polymerase-3 subunit delta|nr:holA [Gammaproteobacteria bacterium]
MKLTYLQLTHHLTKNLMPIYFVSGDELVLVQETVDTICAAASTAGFDKQISIIAESQNDWKKWVYNNMHSLSLFENKKIIKVNLNHIKLNDTTGSLFEEHACKPLTDTLLIITAAKLDAKIEKTSWYKTIIKNGVVIPIWPIPAEQLPQWIIQRAIKKQLQLTSEAAARLATLVEGNLLAAAQEIEKLSLLYHSDKPLDYETIETAVTDNARFDIFNLVDSALLGDGLRCLRILKNLADEGIEPTFIVWAFARELRTLAEIKKQLEQGMTLATLFNKARIWEKRQRGFKAFLNRHTHNQCWKLLKNVAEIDRIIKGIEVGNVWNKLNALVIQIALSKSLEGEKI